MKIPERKEVGVPPAEQIASWAKFVWSSLAQVDGFFPKLKAVGRILSILKNR